MDIDKIIGIVRNLKEDAGPTMAMGHGQIAGSVEAGDEPVSYTHLTLPTICSV